MERSRGNVTVGVLISGASVGLTMIASVFAWTYTQFSSVQVHASQTDIKVATVEQKTSDVDSRLDRIESKLDMLISAKTR
jgi:hypothetical protein